MIRSISILTGAVQAIAEDGWEAEASPDGKQIVYIDGSSQEIRIAGSQGESPRTVFRAPDGELLESAHWLPGGKRIGYLRGRAGAPEAEIETRDLTGGDVRSLLQADTESVAFAPDGRVFYSTKDTAPQTGASLWTLQTDRETGAPVGPPLRLSTWPGAIAAQPITLSADGRRLAVTKLYAQSDVHLLQLDATGVAAGASRQLTTDTQVDWPSQWTRDGSAFLFYSNRDGALHAFRQPLAGEMPQVLVTGSGDVRSPQMTADGKWIVYVEMTTGPDAARVMRVPAAGGPAQEVLKIASRLGTSTLQFFTVNPGTAGAGARSFPEIRCPAHAPDGSCFLAEARPGKAQSSQLVLSAFDPSTGRTREPSTLLEDHAGLAFWDVSPDGATAAFGKFEWGGGDQITLLSMASGDRRVLRPKNVTNLNDIAWAADGRSLFATAATIRRGEVLRVMLDGTPHLLRTFDSQVVLNPRPSPDGRSLLIGLLQTSANAWLIER